VKPKICLLGQTSIDLKSANREKSAGLCLRFLAIDRLDRLADQRRAKPVRHGGALWFRALYRNEPHLRMQGCFADRLSCIIFLAFEKRRHLGGWHAPYILTQLGDLTTPERRAATGFHRDNAGL
jgi:hypothetical protein